MIRHTLAALVLLAPLAACNTLAKAVSADAVQDAAALKTGAYKLDQKHAALTFGISHSGFSQYIGRFNSFDATLDFDAANPAAANLTASIDMASLDIANDSFAETLTGPNWFNAGAYPQAVFRSTAVTVTGDTIGTVTGDLSWRGITSPVTLNVTFNGGDTDPLRGAYVIGFSANGSFNRSDFGVTKFVGPVGDEVSLQIEAEFVKQ